MSALFDKHWDQLEPWLRLFHLPGLGLKRFHYLLEHVGSPEKVLSLSLKGLLESVPKSLAVNIASSSKSVGMQDSLAATRKWLSEPNHHIICRDSSGYPSSLAAIADPPPLLFSQGNPEHLLSPQIAVVGTRSPTPQGKHHAFQLAEALAGCGLTVTSGLALGIDGEAHKGALSGKGTTVAVVATGLDRVYPERHRPLAETISNHGVLVSEFPLGTLPRPGHFPRRNRIISGLSHGVLVVEADVKSGSLITARLANEQGREVFAVPGPINNPCTRGCHSLIREGATLVESVEDILQELTGPLGCWQSVPSHAQDELPETGSESEKQVLNAMGFETCHTDDVVLRTGLPSHRVASLLLDLELDGKIVSVPGGFMRITNRSALDR
ncbi:DNA-processing protein DprA [Kistimonas asteriae]|uniref:DNA-processing protein DprA n=1 Tax=Kistimonas asteriae TaxID=517724 RepID=UPI001BACA6BC|nr:DNA-processing protein DprA [Kistimonas asteriae]